MGPDRFPDMLGRFENQLISRFDDAGPEGRVAATRGAHAIAPSAGMLGFTELAEVCREIEGASVADPKLPLPGDPRGVVLHLSKLQTARARRTEDCSRMTAHMRKEGNETLRVAVVDDDSFYREYVARLLDMAGLRAQAGNGAELLALLSHQEIDCIVLDYNLGGETGLGQLKEALQDPPPVIMLTGKGRDSTIIEAFRGGMSDYLSKHDLTRDKLLRAVRDAVHRKTEERVQRDELARLNREVSATAARPFGQRDTR
jgi:CheY-like chemotaxis protein/HPt (histidine-containing phosphotransfer) domain-containing protein